MTAPGTLPATPPSFAWPEPGTPLVAAALAYAEAGFGVFPCGQDKRPLTAHGCKDATTDPSTIRRWWRTWPDASVAIALDERTIVLDLDVGGDESLAEYEHKHGALPYTARVRTGGGGTHYFFSVPAGCKNRVRVLPGIDVRAAGGYVIAPPSRHVSGACYIGETDGITIAPCPQALLDLLTRAREEPHREPIARRDFTGKAHPYAVAALERIVAEVATTAVGARNGTLNRAAYRAGRFVGGGYLDRQVVAADLSRAARSSGLGDREIDQVLRQGGALDAGAENPIDIPDRQGGVNESGHATEGEAVLIEDLAHKAIAHRLAAVLQSIENGVPRMSTGWPLLDRALSDDDRSGGFVVPSLVVLGAQPKAGKSTFASIVAERHVAAGGHAYHVDFENGAPRFLRRMLCRRAQVGPGALRRGLTAEELARWQAAKKDLSTLGWRLLLDNDRGLTADKLIASVRLLTERAEGRPVLVVVDSLQKCPMPNMEQRRAGVDGWLRSLEKLRDETGCVVLAISELRRPHGDNYQATATSFKESGGIEYSGDLVLGLELDGKDADASTATLTTLYNRDGRTGPVARYRAVYPWYGIDEIPLAGATLTGVFAERVIHARH